MASSISLVAMAILAVVLLSPGSAEGRQKSLDNVGNAALDIPATELLGRHAREEGRKKRKGKGKGRKAKANRRQLNNKRRKGGKKGRKASKKHRKPKYKGGKRGKTGIKAPSKTAKKPTGRQSESKFDHCDYLDLMEVGTRRADCGPGGKFLFKVGFHSHHSFSS